MNYKDLHKLLNFLIAIVWLGNGFFCKVLNLVPRHQQIVATILGGDYAQLLTIFIGLSEMVMAVWILTRYKSKWNAVIQIIVIATMNVLEFVLAPNLLLWGQFNAVFALLFISLIYYNEFVLNKKPNAEIVS